MDAFLKPSCIDTVDVVFDVFDTVFSVAADED
jgi:hypothetical protein